MTKKNTHKKKQTSPKIKQNIPQKLDHSDSSKNPASAAGGGLGGAGGASNAEGGAGAPSVEPRCKSWPTLSTIDVTVVFLGDLGFKKNNTLVMKSRAGCLVLLVFLFGGETLMHFGLKYFCLFLF